VAAIGVQHHAVLLLGRRRPRLGELAGNPAHFHHRLGASEGQDHGHLKEDAEEVTDVVRAMLGEALSAVATLKQKALAIGDGGQRLLQLACLARKNERRIGRHARLDLGERSRVRISRNLADRLVPPRIRRPFCHINTHRLAPGHGLYRPASGYLAEGREGYYPANARETTEYCFCCHRTRGLSELRPRPITPPLPPGDMAAGRARRATTPGSHATGERAPRPRR